MPKNAHSQSYRKMSELSIPSITLAVLDLGHVYRNLMTKHMHLCEEQHNFKFNLNVCIWQVATQSDKATHAHRAGCNKVTLRHYGRQ
jgi:hypothetical protein